MSSFPYPPKRSAVQMEAIDSCLPIVGSATSQQHAEIPNSSNTDSRIQTEAQKLASDCSWKSTIDLH